MNYIYAFPRPAAPHPSQLENRVRGHRALTVVAHRQPAARTQHAHSDTLNEQLQTALNSRVIIEQAEGKLAERLGLGMDQVQPPARLRQDRNLRLSGLVQTFIDETEARTCWAAAPPQQQHPAPHGHTSRTTRPGPPSPAGTDPAEESTFRRAFALVSADVLDRVLGAWLWTRAVQAGGRLVIALDGKTVRGAKDRMARPPHLVAALAHGIGAVPGQVAVDAKPSEIPAARELLKAFASLASAVVTTGAMATIDWDAAITALQAGNIPASSGERSILQLAASIANGNPVALRDTVTTLDNANLQHLLTAIRHTAGHRPG